MTNEQIQIEIYGFVDDFIPEGSVKAYMIGLAEDFVRFGKPEKLQEIKTIAMEISRGIEKHFGKSIITEQALRN